MVTGELVVPDEGGDEADGSAGGVGADRASKVMLHLI
jgi:hypothetical protein